MPVTAIPVSYTRPGQRPPVVTQHAAVNGTQHGLSRGGLNQVLYSSTTSHAVSVQARLLNIRGSQTVGATGSQTNSSSTYQHTGTYGQHRPTQSQTQQGQLNQAVNHAYQPLQVAGNGSVADQYGQQQPRRTSHEQHVGASSGKGTSHFQAGGGYSFQSTAGKLDKQQPAPIPTRQTSVNGRSTSSLNTFSATSLTVGSSSYLGFADSGAYGNGAYTPSNASLSGANTPVDTQHGSTANNSRTAQMLAQGRPLPLGVSTSGSLSSLHHAQMRYSSGMCSASQQGSRVASTELHPHEQRAGAVSDLLGVGSAKWVNQSFQHVQIAPRFMSLSLPLQTHVDLSELGITEDLLRAVANYTRQHWDLSRQYSYEFLSGFIRELCEKMECDLVVCLTGMVYTDRLREKFPDAGANADAKRVFVMGMLLASKFHSDRPYNNKAWAQVSKMALPLLNRMEAQFFESLDFHMNVSTADLAKILECLKTPLRPLKDVVQKVAELEAAAERMAPSRLLSESSAVRSD